MKVLKNWIKYDSNLCQCSELHMLDCRCLLLKIQSLNTKQNTCKQCWIINPSDTNNQSCGLIYNYDYLRKRKKEATVCEGLGYPPPPPPIPSAVVSRIWGVFAHCIIMCDKIRQNVKVRDFSVELFDIINRMIFFLSCVCFLACH